jgi:hypothetical protein
MSTSAGITFARIVAMFEGAPVADDTFVPPALEDVAAAPVNVDLDVPPAEPKERPGVAVLLRALHTP